MHPSDGTLKITAQDIMVPEAPSMAAACLRYKSSTLKSRRAPELKRPQAQAQAQANTGRDYYRQSPIASGQLLYPFRWFSTHDDCYQVTVNH